MSLKRPRSFSTSSDVDAEESVSVPPAKILKRSPHEISALAISTVQGIDLLSALPSELLIRILHLLPVDCILLCALISRKFQRLAADPQIWKGLYYGRFVRPRALRLRGLDGEDVRGRGLPSFNSRQSKWLDEGWLLRDGGGVEEGSGRSRVTDWKARYRLRHNWSIGAAEVSEIGVSFGMEIEEKSSDGERQSGATLMARLADGMVVTVDRVEGLRAWDLKSKECVARYLLTSHEENDGKTLLMPTCLAIDSGSELPDGVGLVVGFQDGSFGVWKLRIRSLEGDGDFLRQYQSTVSKRDDADTDVELSAVAYAHPHLLTITEDQILSLYLFDGDTTVDEDCSKEPSKDLKNKEPRLLSSLKSHTSWPPISLSIRSTPHSIIASIAYAFPTYISGWSVGLQELHLTPSGTILRSRLASGFEQGFRSLLSPSASSSPARSPRLTSSEDIQTNRIVRQERNSHPVSLSYSHPYLLAGNRNNTLSLYIVTSNNEDLKISKSTTLWGHTSSVSGAQVGGRGKAISISAKGEELRIWELEGGLGRKMVGERSVRVRTEAGKGLVEMAQQSRVGGEQAQQRLFVGFDDEVVVVVKDLEDGMQTLVVYDFT